MIVEEFNELNKIKLSDFVKSKIDEIKEELPDEEYLHIFNIGGIDIRMEIDAIFDRILKDIDRLNKIHDDLFSV